MNLKVIKESCGEILFVRQVVKCVNASKLEESILPQALAAILSKSDEFFVLKTSLAIRIPFNLS